MLDKKEQTVKSKKRVLWISFSIGLCIGLGIACVVFFTHKDLFTIKYPIFVSSDKLPMESVEKTDTVFIVKKEIITEPKPIAEIPETDLDSTLFDNLDFSDIDFDELHAEDIYDQDVEFAITIPNQEDVLAVDQIIQSKRITVKSRNLPKGEVVITPPIPYFEVQQWSTPIRNSFSYQLTSNLLKIKGIDISNIDIVYVNKEYYLQNGLHYYLLVSNNDFERLIEVQLTLSQTH